MLFTNIRPCAELRVMAEGPARPMVIRAGARGKIIMQPACCADSQKKHERGHLCRSYDDWKTFVLIESDQRQKWKVRFVGGAPLLLVMSSDTTTTKARSLGKNLAVWYSSSVLCPQIVGSQNWPSCRNRVTKEPISGIFLSITAIRRPSLKNDLPI
jgi:hypothetical protein